ncbi:MAG TPA: hypothetical protein VH189_13045 [Rhizomicrobium sp.]|nr:hypothetical protein [Rhizomicrobium sp.]
MDDNYLLACARYVELNPVRARLVTRARDWRWSSARAHLKGQDDTLLLVSPLLERIADWKAFLEECPAGDTGEAIRASERTGRPLGDKTFIRKLERKLDRTLMRQKPGPKSAVNADQPKLL